MGSASCQAKDCNHDLAIDLRCVSLLSFLGRGEGWKRREGRLTPVMGGISCCFVFVQVESNLGWIIAKGKKT